MRTSRIAAAAAIAVGLMILAGPAAHAAPDGRLVAPYESASSEHECTTSGACSSGASVDGNMSVDARASAYSTGGSASADAWASSKVVAAQELTGSVPEMKYTLHFDLSEAYANTGNRFWDEAYGDSGELGAQFWLTLSAEHSTCESCSIPEFVVWSATRYWWDDTGQYSTWAPAQTSYPVTMRNRAGGSLPAGTIRFTVRLKATAYASVYRSSGPRTHPECVFPQGGEGCALADTQSWAEAQVRAVGRLTGIDHEILAPNQVPTARFTVSCTKTDCRFDAGGSSDPDGQITAYSWSFGDGRSASGPTTQHRYSEGAASYIVTLTVTDDRDGTDAESRTVRCTRKNQNKPTTCS